MSIWAFQRGVSIRFVQIPCERLGKAHPYCDLVLYENREYPPGVLRLAPKTASPSAWGSPLSARYTTVGGYCDFRERGGKLSATGTAAMATPVATSVFKFIATNVGKQFHSKAPTTKHDSTRGRPVLRRPILTRSTLSSRKKSYNFSEIKGAGRRSDLF